MILKQKVVAKDLGKLDWGAALLRSIFVIVFGLIGLYFSIEWYSDPDFQAANGWMESSVALQEIMKEESFFGRNFNYLYMVVLVIEMIVLLLDKKAQSLHDKIASTFVVKT